MSTDSTTRRAGGPWWLALSLVVLLVFGLLAFRWSRSATDAAPSPQTSPTGTVSPSGSPSDSGQTSPSSVATSTTPSSTSVASQTATGSATSTSTPTSTSDGTSTPTPTPTPTHPSSPLVLLSGSGQSSNVTHGYGAPLVVRVLDSVGNPMAGVAVTFTAPSSGASATFSAVGCTQRPSPTVCVVTSDATGTARSASITANGVSGSFHVTAATTGSAAVTFSLVNGEPFTVTLGTVSPALFPGAPASVIPVTVTNPNPFAISVVSLTITVSSPTCDPGTNLRVRQVDLTTAATPGRLIVPAGASVSLSAQGVANPTLRLIETNQDQTATCAGATIHLGYEGVAQP